MEIMDNVIASQVVDGEYVPDADQLTLKDIVTSSLQLVNVDSGNFSSKLWQSVFWDPVYARPDEVTSYLNKVLNINQGNHTVTKSNSYSDKGEGGISFGIPDLFTMGGQGGGSSSNSATFSELHEWLIQHNYDVEIQGNIFIPKSLSLKQLNMGVLDRQETIFTKSVQLHHVDAPGTLRVTIGTKSVVENEDIKVLRNRLDTLDGRVDGVVARESQDTEALKNDVTKLQNLTSQMHIPNCSGHSTGTYDIKPCGGSVLCLDGVPPVVCPAGKTLSHFHFVRPHGMNDQLMQVDYTCC